MGCDSLQRSSACGFLAIGGIVSNGLTNSDLGKKQAAGGLFNEF